MPGVLGETAVEFEIENKSRRRLRRPFRHGFGRRRIVIGIVQLDAVEPLRIYPQTFARGQSLGVKQPNIFGVSPTAATDVYCHGWNFPGEECVSDEKLTMEVRFVQVRTISQSLAHSGEWSGFVKSDPSVGVNYAEAFPDRGKINIAWLFAHFFMQAGEHR